MATRSLGVIVLSLTGLWLPAADRCGAPDEPQEPGCPGDQDCHHGLSASQEQEARGGKKQKDCSADTQSDPHNCGACHNACKFAHAQAVCVDGQCQLGECRGPFADCNHNSQDGCETNLARPSDCGGCGVLCGYSETCCQAGCCRTEPVCSGACDPYCTSPGTWSVSDLAAVDYANGGRLWERRNNPQMDYPTAEAYCASLLIDGISGWRLPTTTEIATLKIHCGGLNACNPGTCCPCFDQAVFSELAIDLYWTSPSAYWGDELVAAVLDNSSGRVYPRQPSSYGASVKCTHDPL